MIRRYFYIRSALLYILLTPTQWVRAEVIIRAEVINKQLEELARKTNAPPNGINYQGSVRDENGTILSKTLVNLKFNLSSGSEVIWEETHEVVTDEFGMVTVVIGSGTRTAGVDSFTDVDWSTEMAVKIEMDQGDGFVVVGEQNLQSVPYANFAPNGMTTAQWEKLESLSAGAEANIQSDWSQTDHTSDDLIKNKPTIPADIKQLTDTDGKLTGTIFDGSYNNLTDLPANLDTDSSDDFSGDYEDLTNKPTIPSSMDDLSNTEGNSKLAGTFTADSLVIDGAFSFPAADGSNGQVLQTNGSGVTSWVSPSASSFSHSNTVISGGDSDDDFVFGSDHLADDDATTEDDKRMFFDKSKGAFRAGRANSTQWDDSKVGNSSMSTGRDSIASNGTSHAIGGTGNTASGYSAFIAGGVEHTASATRSFIGGGNGNTVSASYAATVGGRGLQNGASNATAVGAYNSTTSGMLFVVGNGSGSSDKSDALIIRSHEAKVNVPIIVDSIRIDGAFSRPGSAGSSGQVLATNGSGTVTWANVFAGTGTSAFVAGASSNTALDGYSTISGGRNNKVGVEELIDAGFQAKSATVGGGHANTVMSSYNTVSGGYQNSASGTGSTVGGGRRNRAGGASLASSQPNAYSTIGGGKSHTTKGKFSTIPGGYGLYTQSFGATVIGTYNKTTGGTQATFVATEPLLVVGNGTSSSAKSDALVIQKNGDTDLNGTFKADSLAIDGAFGLPTSDETIGQVLTTNGSGVVSWGSIPQTSGEGSYSSVTHSNTASAARSAAIAEAGLQTSSVAATVVGTYNATTGGDPTTMNPVTYKWNNKTSRDTTELNIGLIAQEVEKHLPELVNDGANGYKSVKYMSLVLVLIQAIKELSAQNDTLTVENDALESRQGQEEERLAALESQMVQLLEALTSSNARGKDKSMSTR